MTEKHPSAPRLTEPPAPGATPPDAPGATTPDAPGELNGDALLLLGLLRGQARHGYQLNDFIERNLVRVTTLKKATAYALLARLEARGLVQARAEQPGNRPPRRVYALTSAGEAAFLRDLSLTLARPPLGAPDVALMFMDALEAREAAARLRERLAALDSTSALLAMTPVHARTPGVGLAVARQLALNAAERAWLLETLAGLEFQP